MPAATPTTPHSLTPPEEQFWHRYSPHHEFPLSSATSIALHALAIALLALLGWWIAKMTTAQQTPLSDVPVVIEPGGSGGKSTGVGNNSGGLPSTSNIEDTGPKADDKTKPTAESPRNDLTQPGAPVPAPLPPIPDDETKRLMEQGRIAAQESRHIDAENRQRAREGLRGKNKQDGGGSKTGKDKGEGDGSGIGNLEQREARMGRWVMVFDTYSGEDYARQLAALEAILAVPKRDGNKVSYFVIHDLSGRPARGKIEDLAEVKRVYWEDDKRESIAPLCLALGIRPVPDHMLAFFPEKLERKLLQMELQYQGLKEEQIKQTRFKVRKTTEGYEPVVIEQKAK